MNLWQRAATTLYRRVDVLHKLLNPAPPRERKILVDVRALEREEWEAYRRFRPSSAEEAWKRFDLGHVPIVAWHEGAVIGACWVARGRAYIPYLECDIVLPADAIYTYNAYTIPEYRGNSVGQIRYAGVCAEFLKRGFRHGYAVVAVENRSGFRSAVKGDYEVVGRHSLARLGPWKRRRDEPLSGAYPLFAATSGSC